MHPMNFHHPLDISIYNVPFEQPRPKQLIRLPRVVENQKSKFEENDMFKKLSRESEVRYTALKEQKDPAVRQQLFLDHCRSGYIEVACVVNGIHLPLSFSPSVHGNTRTDDCDYVKESGKVHIKSSFIMNGVCVRWTGWLDLKRQDGVGILEFDEERAAQEDIIYKQQMERYKAMMQARQQQQRQDEQQENIQHNNTNVMYRNYWHHNNSLQNSAKLLYKSNV